MATKSKGKTASSPSKAGASAVAAEFPSFRPVSTDMGKERFVDVGGIRTRYFDEGKGAPIFFIHGAQMGARDGASSGRTWALNFPVLASGHNVIAYDKLGQGYTDNPKSDADYTMHATVQHAIGLLEKLGKGPYHVVGHSRGGYISARIALERPDLVKSCVCISSGTLSPGQSRTHIVFKNPPLPALSRESVRWYLERYSYSPKIVTEDWIEGSLAIAATEKNRIAVRKMNEEGLLKRQFAPQLFKQKGETTRWLIERGMPCPTLVVWGLDDPAADLDNGMQLVELFMMKQRDTEVRLFNQSGHFVMREQAAGFNRMLDAWVSAHA
jgi:pimeloyl-ACP methyl ester carboxylesterase